MVAAVVLCGAAVCYAVALVCMLSWGMLWCRGSWLSECGRLVTKNDCQTSSCPSARRQVKEAHRRIMIANHPDAGGSSFIAAKVNEAKDMMLGKKQRGSSIF